MNKEPGDQQQQTSRPILERLEKEDRYFGFPVLGGIRRAKSLLEKE